MTIHQELDGIHLVAEELDRAAAFNRQAKVSQPEHRRRLYRQKDLAIVKALLLGGAQQFIVDSVEGGHRPIWGLSHRHSGRRFHVRVDLMPPEVQDLLETMAGSCSGRSNVLTQFRRAYR